MCGKKLGDFKNFTKIGGKDIQAVGGGGDSQSGVCSYVYLTQLRGGNGTRSRHVSIIAAFWSTFAR